MAIESGSVLRSPASRNGLPVRSARASTTARMPRTCSRRMVPRPGSRWVPYTSTVRPARATLTRCSTAAGAGLVGQPGGGPTADRQPAQRSRAGPTAGVALGLDLAAEAAGEDRLHAGQPGQLGRHVVEPQLRAVAVDLLQQHDVGVPPADLGGHLREVVGAVACHAPCTLNDSTVIRAAPSAPGHGLTVVPGSTGEGAGPGSTGGSVTWPVPGAPPAAPGARSAPARPTAHDQDRHDDEHGRARRRPPTRLVSCASCSSAGGTSAPCCGPADPTSALEPGETAATPRWQRGGWWAPAPEEDHA